jgi:hypothetical protein
MTRELMRKYMNIKLSRNLTDRKIAEMLGISRDKLISLKKTWKLPLKKQKDNMQGLSERDFEIGALHGLSRSIILRRYETEVGQLRKAIREPKDETKIHTEWRTKNDK